MEDNNEKVEVTPQDDNHTPPPLEVVDEPKICDTSNQNITDPPQQPEPKRRSGRVNLNRGPLTEKENCPDCGKLLSKHALIYNTHKCPVTEKKYYRKY